MAAVAGNRLPILIIGSGLGGLTLAQSLAKHKIPYRLFERDSAASQRAQGYRISIGDGGADGLRAALPPYLYERFEATCAEQHPPAGRINARTGVLERAGLLGLLFTGGWTMFWRLAKRMLSKKYSGATLGGALSTLKQLAGYPPVLTHPVLPAGGDKHLQVDRRVLRSILLTDQSEHITYDAALTCYTSEDDSITAHFSDGTFAKGSLLVGADGTGSKVAAQLIGAPAAPRDLGMRILYGKTPLTHQLQEVLHPAMKHGVAFVMDETPGGHRLFMVCECMRFTSEGTPPDYVFWAISGVKEAFEQDPSKRGISNAEAAQLAARLTAGWDRRIRVLMDKQSLEETANAHVELGPGTNSHLAYGSSSHCPRRCYTLYAAYGRAGCQLCDVIWRIARADSCGDAIRGPIRLE